MRAPAHNGKPPPGRGAGAAPAPPVAVARALALALLVTGLGGCLSRVAEDPPGGGLPPERLRTIEPLELQARPAGEGVAPPDFEEGLPPRARAPEEGAPAPAADGAAAPLPLGGGRSDWRAGLEPERIGLGEARLRAIDQNLGLRAQLVAAGAAAPRVDRERAAFDATFSSVVSYTDSRLGGGTYSTLGGARVSRRLPGGATVDLEGSTSETEMVNFFTGLASRSYQSELKATASQPLLRGAGLQVNTAPIRIAQLNAQATEARTKLAVIRLLAEVEVAYWDVELARRVLVIQEDQLKIAQQQAKNVDRLIAARLVARAERSRAAAGIMTQRESVIIARTDVLLKERALRRILRLPLDDPRPIEPATNWAIVPLRLDRDALLGEAREQRMDLAASELQVLIEDLNVRLARDATLPSVSLDLTYARGGGDPNLRRSFSRAIDSRRTTEDLTTGLTVSYPWGNRAAQADHLVARLNRLRALVSRDDTALQVEQEILDAVDRLERDWERIVANQAAVQASEDAYRAEYDQFLRGLRTSTEVLNASRAWASAQVNLASAKSDFATARVLLANATGTLLGYGKITWEPVADPEAPPAPPANPPPAAPPASP